MSARSIALVAVLFVWVVRSGHAEVVAEPLRDPFPTDDFTLSEVMIPCGTVSKGAYAMYRAPREEFNRSDT